MSEGFQQLGHLLKKRREELNFSLKEVENAISIRSSYLHFIEEGQLERLISPVYAHGFLRKYAKFLQFDENQLLNAYPLLQQQMNDQTESLDFANLGSIEVRGSPKSDSKWFSTLALIGGSSISVLLIWWAMRSLGVV